MCMCREVSCCRYSSCNNIYFFFWRAPPAMTSCVESGKAWPVFRSWRLHQSVSDEGGSTGSRTILTSGRCSVMVAVRSVSTLVRPSWPGWHCSTRGNGHLVGGSRSSVRSTRSPSWIVWLGSSHLERCCSSCRTYFCHLCQRWSRICVVRRYRAGPKTENSVVDGSGRAVSAQLTRK